MQNEISQQNNHEPVYQSWAERNGFADWALALIWIIVAFILFQLTASIIAIILIAAQHGLSSDPAKVMSLMADNLNLLFIGNSTGQILFLGLATWFFSRLHTSRRRRSSFLRFKIHDDTWQKIGVTVFLVVAVQPAIWFLSWLNAFIPVPEAFSNLQNSQMEMIENYLRGDHMILVTLFHVALVPAICEETLYRGYVMSAFQKSWGTIAAIFFSGLLFGLYHVQLSNLLPLASLGMLFAYITWTTKSLYPAIVAHFVNNGGSVLVGKYYPNSAFAEMTPETLPPMSAVIPSLLITAYVVYWLYNQHQQTAVSDGGNHYV